MNKTIIINISGIVFHIEEEAYDVLRTYMIDVKRHFGTSSDSQEIVGDIENRIAEMFSERIVPARKEVITMQDVEDVIQQMGRVSDFQHEAGEGMGADSADSKFEDTMNWGTGKKLFRDTEDRILGGVCSGVGHFFGIESRWIRLAVLALAIIYGAGLLVYVVMWIVIPPARTRADRMAMRGKAPNLQNFKRSFEEEMEALRTNFTEAEGKTNSIFRSATTGIQRVFGFIVKTIAFIIIAMTCLALVILLLSTAVGVGLITNADGNIYLGLHMIEPSLHYLALIGIAILLIVPLIALLNLTTTWVFKRKIFGKQMGYALLAIWLGAAGLTAFIAVQTALDFSEQSTIVEVENIQPKKEYTLKRNNLSVINIGMDDVKDGGKLRSKLEGDRGFQIMKVVDSRSNEMISEEYMPHIRFKKTDAGNLPSISYEYEAKGSTYENATKRTGEMSYSVEQRDSLLIFDSHIKVPKHTVWRTQNLWVIVNLPVGTIVNMDLEMYRYTRGIKLHACTTGLTSNPSQVSQSSRWIMSEEGLICYAANQNVTNDAKEGASAR